MLGTLLSLGLIVYLPGALIFRLPVADRTRRSRLPVEERVFWAIILSTAVSSATALGLATVNYYHFERLLILNGGLCLLIAGLSRLRLRLEPKTPRPSSTVLVPAALVVLGLWLYFPPAEYIMGGKDPGTYMNQGIQIAQRGSLVTVDQVIASLPHQSRDLFFRAPNPDRLTQAERKNPTSYGNRFMGFFIVDPDEGMVLGQFPHLYPVWIAIGYGLDGLTGARRVIGFFGILGVLAVYFAGTRLVGRPAAAAGASLLAVHVLQIWYGRYPNSELLMQTLLFAGLLAYARTQLDRDRFFSPVAATLIGLLLFVRSSAILAIVAIVGASLISVLDAKRPRASFLIPLAIFVGLATIYLVDLMAPYTAQHLEFFRRLQPFHFSLLALGGAGLLALLYGARHPNLRAKLHTWLPPTLIIATLTAVTYGYFIRQAAPGLGVHDANALRTFTSFYLTPYGLAAALLGYTLVVRRSFWQSSAFILTVTIFAFFFFYKTRIIPEHFWMGRRFLPVILPGALLLIGAGALGEGLPRRIRVGTPLQPVQSQWIYGLKVVRFLLGLVFIVLLGRQYYGASQPILNHVEYAGIIARLESLAGRFGDDDLVLIEARAVSDMHVLGLPLSYIYARNVLVFNSANPDKLAFLEFLTWAKTKYRDVYFVGGGGTDLLSQETAVTAVDSKRFQVPEYESQWNTYPRGVRYKEFQFGIYKFVPPQAETEWFALDIGTMDDLHVRRFHAKERLGTGQTTFRWTRKTSFISILPSAAEHSRLVTLWLSNGGRPEGVPKARVVIYLNDRLLGTATITEKFLPYSFAIRPEMAEKIAKSKVTATLKILSNTWVPRDAHGGQDGRELGIMIDRVEVR